MPRKKSSIEPAKRNRENQRRSRARQKELVNGLQRQLRKYEEKEIQATLVMQLAARRVAWENTQLRALLATNGISQESIDSFLSHQERMGRRGPTDDSPRGGLLTGNATQVAEERLLEALKTRNQIAQRPSEARVPKADAADQKYMRSVGAVANNLTPPTPFCGARESMARGSSPATVIQRGVPIQAVPATENLCGFDGSDPLSFTDVESKSILPPVSECFCPTPPATSSLAEDDSLLGTMSCEMAANIISSMRGNGDSEQARSQLGCTGRENCNVNNIRVLRVMEMD